MLVGGRERCQKARLQKSHSKNNEAIHVTDGRWKHTYAHTHSDMQFLHMHTFKIYSESKSCDPVDGFSYDNSHSYPIIVSGLPAHNLTRFIYACRGDLTGEQKVKLCKQMLATVATADTAKNNFG